MALQYGHYRSIDIFMEIIEEKYIWLTIKTLLSLQLKKSQAYQGNKQMMVGTVELTQLPIMHLFILLYFKVK